LTSQAREPVKASSPSATSVCRTATDTSSALGSTARGRVLDALAPDARAAKVFELPLGDVEPPLYTRVGDLFAYAAAALFALLMALGRRRRGLQRQPNGP
jgi:apolipoprotein N-acyltransferase